MRRRRLLAPRVRHTVEGEDVQVDADAPGDRVVEQFEVRSRFRFVRRRQVGVPDDADVLSAERCGRNRRFQACGRSQVDQAAAEAQRAERGDGGLAPQRVDHDVDLAACSIPVRGREVAVAERHERVRAELTRALERVGVARGRNHRAGAEQLGTLHCDLTDRAGRAEHQDGSSLRHVGLREREPRGQPRDAERRRDRVVGFVGKGHERLGCAVRVVRQHALATPRQSHAGRRRFAARTHHAALLRSLASRLPQRG